MTVFGVIFIAGFFGVGLAGPLDLKCQLQFSPPEPLIFTNFGSKQMLVKKHLSVLSMNNGESASTYCSSGFLIRSRHYDYEASTTTTTKLHWICEQGYLKTDNDEVSRKLPNINNYLDPDSRTVTVHCQSENKLAAFQSVASLKDCMVQTYVVGAILTTNKKNVAVCYDIEKLQLKFVSYVAHAEKVEYLEKIYGANELDFIGLDLLLPEIDTFLDVMTPSDFNVLSMQEEERNVWYNSKWFIFKSIVHDLGPANDASALDNMLNIVWLTSLYHGNWRHFMRALHQRSADVSYNVRLGISGVVEQPVSAADSCSKLNRTVPLVFNKTDMSITVPKYVWAYLKALQRPAQATNAPAETETTTEMASVSELEEFVIIGVNSPYLQSDNSQELCTDICNTIPWLNTDVFGKLRLLPSNGILICCRIEDVADKLEGFPYTKGSTYNFTSSFKKPKIVWQTFYPGDVDF